MTFHPGRYIGFALAFVVLSMVASPAADWLRTRAQLPPGYGAEGDRRRANPIPALIRETVEEQSARSEGSWVRERVEVGAWVYELHLSRDDKESVIRITSSGDVIPPNTQDPKAESGTAVEAGE